MTSRAKKMIAWSMECTWRYSFVSSVPWLLNAKIIFLFCSKSSIDGPRRLLSMLRMMALISSISWLISSFRWIIFSFHQDDLFLQITKDISLSMLAFISFISSFRWYSLPKVSFICFSIACIELRTSRTSFSNFSSKLLKDFTCNIVHFEKISFSNNIECRWGRLTSVWPNL